MVMTQPSTCPRCGKAGYLTRAAATWWARHARELVRLRVSCCPPGQGCHLTSRRLRRRGSRQPAAPRMTARTGMGRAQCRLTSCIRRQAHRSWKM